MGINKVQISFTLASGFLGTGKTTLINHWLTEGFGDQAVAVIVNDFGKVSVDASLIKTQSQNMLELHNGCVCCTLAGDLTRGLDRLLSQGTFDRILMETSGITQVTPLRKILQSSALAEQVVLEQVVILVDAVRHSVLRKVILTIDEQVRNASVVLVNRCDLANAEQLQTTREALAEVNSAVELIETRFGQVPFSRIEGAAATQGSTDNFVDAGGPSWSTCRLEFGEPIGREGLQKILEALPETVQRVKGLVQSEEGACLEVQRVGQETNVSEVAMPGDSATLNVLVAIGPQGVQAELEAALANFATVRVEPDTAVVQHGH